MNSKMKFLIICIFLSAFLIAGVSASENNTGDVLSVDSNVKQTPVVAVNASSVYTQHSIGISLKDSNNAPISGQKVIAKVNNEYYSMYTDDNGKTSLQLKLKPNSYILKVAFKGNDNYTAVSKKFNINVVKLKSLIKVENTTVLNKQYFNATLKDKFGNPMKNKKVTFTVNKLTYTTKTDKNGLASFKNTFSSNAIYPVKISYAGSTYYKAVSRTLSMVVPATTSVVIGNEKLLTKGYLRVYLKSPTLSAISDQKLLIKIGNSSFSKTTNAEGCVIFAPKLGTGNLMVTVVYKGTATIFGSNSSKNVIGVEGSTKSPYTNKIALINGVPDIDMMPGSYVMADGDMKYTLLKSQYQDTIKRDSQTLYLYKKMSKYVLFKTKQAPKLKHVIVREKWNVIERAVNTKVVLANKAGYWPKQITVSLKGKSYTYPQVRDVQDTGYTCGPTSSSMCSQVLKNYRCESELAILSKTTYEDGSFTDLLAEGLEECGYKCTIYDNSTYKKAINELKKGACALIFHTWNHYVAILDISKDGKQVLVGNPSGDYDHGSHSIPTNWLTVDYMYSMFNDYDTTGLIVNLNYNLADSAKTQLDNLYNSFGVGWTAQNTNERIPQI